MSVAWSAAKSLIAHPGILKAGPALDWFLCRYMREFRLREVGGHLILHSHLPPLNSAAYGRFVDEHLTRRNDGPSHAQIAVTNTCPQHCAFCYNRDRTGTPLATAEILRVVDQLADAGVFWLGLTGGEPLVCEDLTRVVRHAAQRCAVKLFTTGCTLLPRQAADLKRAGLFSVSVSLDHWDEAIHDRGRDYPGAFKAALAAIATFKSEGLDTGVSAVLSKEMVANGEVEPFLAFLETLEVDEIWLSETKPAVRGWWDDALLITEAERRDLIALQDRYNRRRGRHATLNYLAHFESAERFGCTAGRKMVYVDAFGEVSPCVFVPVSFGNVRDGPLAGILERMRSVCRPGSECFISANYGALRDRAGGGLPIGAAAGEEIMRRVGHTPPGRFFRMHESRFGAGGAS